MGFYSIYKIIKDMIKTLFGKHALKLIIICVIISVILFVLDKKTAYAVSPVTLTYNQETHNFTLKNSEYKVNDSVFNMPYLLFYEDTRANQYWVRVVASSEPFYFTKISDGRYHISCDISTDIYYNDFTYLVPNYFTSISTTNISDYPYHYKLNNQTLSNDFFISQDNIFYLNFNINDYNNKEDVLFSSNEIVTFIPPSLGNTSSELENLSFSNFIINANSFTDELKNNDGLLYMLFYNRSLSNPQTTDGLYPIKEKIFVDGSIYIDYENSTDDNLIFKYPIFKTGVMFNVGSTYEIKFAKVTGWYDNDTPLLEYFDNSYTFTISRDVTQDYINELNQQTATSSDEDNNKELQNKINNQTNAINNQTNAINNQTQSIDNINNSITDSSVDNSSIDLPTDNTVDPTQNGVDNIFQTIYNSFTSGTAQDIVFPIPNTNKNITLSANYTYNSLQNNNASWVVTIIQAFWWYIISRFIITDVMDKIRKLKQGDLDNIENSNIKEDML